MARINKTKLAALMDHICQGGATDKASLAASIGGTTRTSDATIEAYLAAAGEEDEELAGIEIGGATLFYDPEEDGPKETEETPSEEEDEQEDEDEGEPEGVEEEEEEEAPKPKPKPKKKKKKEYRFFYEQEDGTSIELERVESKSDSIVRFREKKAQQIVKLMIAGNIVEIDVVPLRMAPPKEINEYKMSNEKLLALAIAAQ